MCSITGKSPQDRPHVKPKVVLVFLLFLLKKRFWEALLIFKAVRLQPLLTVNLSVGIPKEDQRNKHGDVGLHFTPEHIVLQDHEVVEALHRMLEVHWNRDDWTEFVEKLQHTPEATGKQLVNIVKQSHLTTLRKPVNELIHGRCNPLGWLPQDFEKWITPAFAVAKSSTKINRKDSLRHSKSNVH